MKLFKKTAAVLLAGSILLSPVCPFSFSFDYAAEAASTQTLSKGMTGSDVKALQEALALLGYDCGTPDGIYGQKTVDAVKKLQGDVGLDADGKAGPQTQDVIKNLVEMMGGSYATVAPFDTAAQATATPKKQEESTQIGSGTSAYVTSTWLKLRETQSTSAKILKSIPKNTKLDICENNGTWCKTSYGGKTGYVMTAYLSFTEPTATNTPTPVKTEAPAAKNTPAPVKTEAPTKAPEATAATDAYTESTWLKLRETPSTSGKVIKSIPGRTQFTITETGSTWCKAVYGGKQGYVMTKYVVFGSVPKATTIPTITEAPAATSTPAPTATATVTATASSTPAVTATAAATNTPAPTATASPTPAPTQKPQESKSYTVMTSSTWLKLREAASTSAAVLASIPGGIQFTVTEKGDTWSAAEYDGVKGYVMTKYLLFLSSPTETPTAAPTVTPSAAPTATPTAAEATPAPTEESTLSAYVKGGSLNLRASGSTSAKILKTIPNNTLLIVYEKGSSWSSVVYNNIAGYVMTKYLDFTAAAATPTPVAPTAAPSDTPTITPTATPTASTTTKPDLSLVLKAGATGEQVSLLQNRLVELGYLNTASGTYDAATTAAVKVFQKAAGVFVDGVAGPITLTQLYGSDITAETTPVTPTATPTISTTSKPDTSLILKTGATGEQVMLLQNRLVELGYLSAASGTYDAATTAAVKQFQKAAGVSTDGVAGPITLKKLYGSDITSETTPVPQLGAGVGKITPPSASSVKLLHWYDYVKTKYRSGQKVLVYDPASGLAWNLRFYAMGHHADSEPVTAEDTLIMYYAFGLTNTWTPKAVWVQLPGGEWTMATMHNVPHLSGSIKTNDFDGHLCVHFLRDMDECSKNDPKYGVQHQNALRAAWKALTGETITK